MNYNLLYLLQKANWHWCEPKWKVPHIVIHDALPQDIYDQLASEFPSDEIVMRGMKYEPNTRYQISAKVSGLLTEVWKEFVSYHTSQGFFNAVKVALNFDCDGIVKMRDKNNQGLVTDCQLSINTPPDKESTVKGPHIDNQVELYAGLFYMRHPDDDSEGGDLELYNRKPDCPEYKPKEIIDQKYLEHVRIIPYKANTFVLFLNTPDAIHGVSPRKPTKYSRRFVNVIGERY